MRTFIYAFLTSIIFSATIIAQERPDPATPQGENLQYPEGWTVRLDHSMPEAVIGSDPDSSDIYFVNMTPGWHVTTGPAGIFYHPANTADGNYTLEATIYLFDPGERNREAFGVFFGGENLDMENQEYLYFLIRNTGEFLIKSRTGDETSLIKDWTANDAIVKYENSGGDESSGKNDLSVAVSDQNLTFTINGQEVAQVNSEGLKTDGLVGLRINHSINVHVSNLRIVE